jgi:DNA-binding CsgD family transcriptional regulator
MDNSTSPLDQEFSVVCEQEELIRFCKTLLRNKLSYLARFGKLCLLIDFPVGSAFSFEKHNLHDILVILTFNSCPVYLACLSEHFDCEIDFHSYGSFGNPTLPKRKNTLWPANASHLNPSLAPRLKKVIRLLASGMENKSIARDLKISEKSVQIYVEEIFRLVRVANPNLKIQNRTQLALWFWGVKIKQSQQPG